MSEPRRKAELAEYARRLHARGWVANHDGNVSVREGAATGQQRYLATPTATSKAAVTAESLIVVDEAGAKVAGPGKPFSEIGLHLTVYRNRPDVNAVIHAHPPTATGFAVAGVGLDEPLLPEAVVSLGPGIPTVPPAAPGPAACQVLAPLTGAHDAVLLGGHGVLTWGVDLEQAYLRMELVEHLAKVALVARQLGGARPVAPALLPALLEARRKAGLGQPAPAAASPAEPAKKVVVACAPAPPGSDVEVYDPKRSKAAVLPSPPSPIDLAAIIRQEIANALKK
jgi:L-fuculose-phosphate aldolase